jgi:hypothetical protein
MKRRLIPVLLSFGLSLFLMPQITSADEIFIAEAIADIEDLIKYGKEGNTDLAMSRAKAALAEVEAAEKTKAAFTHAEGSQNAKANPHAKLAIKHLKEAIVSCERGNTLGAITYGEAALSKLREVR